MNRKDSAQFHPSENLPLVSSVVFSCRPSKRNSAQMCTPCKLDTHITWTRSIDLKMAVTKPTSGTGSLTILNATKRVLSPTCQLAKAQEIVWTKSPSTSSFLGGIFGLSMLLPILAHLPKWTSLCLLPTFSFFLLTDNDQGWSHLTNATKRKDKILMMFSSKQRKAVTQ